MTDEEIEADVRKKVDEEYGDEPVQFKIDGGGFTVVGGKEFYIKYMVDFFKYVRDYGNKHK